MNNLDFGTGAVSIVFANEYSTTALLLLALWSVLWKGLSLWHSGRRGQAWWFVILLVVNTLGLLEIVYLFGILKLKFSELFSKKN